MVPLPPLTILDPYAWERSTVNRLALGELVSAGQLAANEEGRNTKFSRVEGELIVLSITNANQELALQEQGETVRGLEQTVEAERRALEVERKQVEGEPLFDSCVVGFFLEGSHSFSDFFLV
jgi:hypothetical protein